MAAYTYKTWNGEWHERDRVCGVEFHRGPLSAKGFLQPRKKRSEEKAWVCGFGVQQLLHMNNSRIKKATAAAAKKKSRWCQNIFFSSHMKGVHLITSNVRIGSFSSSSSSQNDFSLPISKKDILIFMPRFFLFSLSNEKPMTSPFDTWESPPLVKNTEQKSSHFWKLPLSRTFLRFFLNRELEFKINNSKSFRQLDVWSNREKINDVKVKRHKYPCEGLVLRIRLLSPVEGSNLTWKKISVTTFSLRPEFVHCGLLGQL